MASTCRTWRTKKQRWWQTLSATLKVGGVRNYLHDRMKECMVARYCEGEPSGESIFESDSLIRLPLDEREDHWMHDETTATWTRIIAVPRKGFYYPSERSQARFGTILQYCTLPWGECPRETGLRDARSIILEDGAILRDIGEVR